MPTFDDQRDVNICANSATPSNAAGEQRAKATCSCASTCDLFDEHHDPAQQSRFPWLSTRVGRATSKGVGGGLLATLVFTPCPCCGGVILACLRGLLSALIGLGVGLFAYRRQPSTTSDDQPALPQRAAMECQ